MHFGFALELSNIDLLNIDLLGKHLDLLDTDIPCKYFVCLHNVFKTFSRHFFKTFSRYIYKTSSRPTSVCLDELLIIPLSISKVTKAAIKYARLCEIQDYLLSYVSKRQYMETVSYIVTSLSFYYSSSRK